jgi:hypothetical protein
MATVIDPREVVTILNGNFGRPDVVYDEILDILETNLPPLLRHLGLKDRFIPGAWHYAGEEIKTFPAIVVGGKIDTSQAGSGFEDEIHVNVTCAVGPQLSRHEFIASLMVISATRGLLYHPSVRGSHVREVGGRQSILWYTLTPQGFSVVPQDYKHFGGWTLNLQAGQMTQSNLWQEE